MLQEPEADPHDLCRQLPGWRHVHLHAYVFNALYVTSSIRSYHTSSTLVACSCYMWLLPSLPLSLPSSFLTLPLPVPLALPLSLSLFLSSFLSLFLSLCLVPPFYLFTLFSLILLIGSRYLDLFLSISPLSLPLPLSLSLSLSLAAA